MFCANKESVSLGPLLHFHRLIFIFKHRFPIHQLVLFGSFFFFFYKMMNRFYCLFWAHSIADINWCSNLFDFDCWTPGWFLICDWYFNGLVENWIDFWFLQSKLKVTKKTAERWSNWPKRSVWTSRLLIAVVIHIE